jgi:circadian clock protein KaiB
MKKLELQLFVVGHSIKGRTAMANIQRIVKAKLPGRCALEVIDVLEQPDAAEDANVMATPTLIKKAPAPVWRIIGDLSVTEKVLQGLGIDDEADEDGEDGSGGGTGDDER